MPTSPPAIGLFHELEPAADVVVGRNVAVDGFIAALSSFAEAFAYHVFCPHRMTLEARRTFGYGAVTVQDRRTVPDALRTMPFAAWHATAFEPYAPFAVRAQAATPLPVTLVHHTISYKEIRHEAVLPLLLADTRPYDALICTSSAAAHALRTLIDTVAAQFNEAYGTRLQYKGRYESIPLAVDTERFHPIDRDEARNRFQLAEDAFVLLWIGRLSLVDKADLLPLLHVLAHLKEANPTRDILLVCAGTQRPGEQFGDVITAYAADLGLDTSVRVMTEKEQFMPWLPQLYAAADVFLSPADNIQETFGLTVIEAMACGTPQIVADWNGYRDTVVEGETGFRIPTYWAPCDADLDGLTTTSAYDHLALAQSVAVDLKLLAHAIQRLMDNPDLCARMAAASRRRAATLYDWSAVIAQYEALWTPLHQQARQETSLIQDTTRYARPHYTATFGHYASKMLADETTLTLTPRGQALFTNQSQLPLPFNTEWAYLDVAMMQRILIGFLKTKEADGVMSVARICAVLVRNEDAASITRSRVLRHVLWLIKYGFVEASIS